MSTPDTATTESPVASSLNEQVREERRRATAALLRRPLLQSFGNGQEDFPLVRRHAEVLRDWFSRHCGWALRVESDLARLRKAPADAADATRPQLDSNGRPFTRRRYVLLCLTLAMLEKSERQTVLRQLAEQIAARFTLEPRLASLGFTFDVSLRDHRRDLIEVIRFLIDQQVLVKVDGDELQFLVSQQDVLYNINLRALAALPNFRRGPSTISDATTDARVAAMIDEPHPDTDEGRNRRLRIACFRRLLDDPVVYYSDLSAQENAYLITQRPSIAREIEAATGLVQEARKEGLAMVDAEGEMIDVGMPEEGTDGHITLLVAERLATRLRSGEPASTPISDIERYIESLVPRHRSHWRKSVSDPGQVSLLVAQALWKLEQLRLVVCDSAAQTVTPRPAIGRFSLGELPTPRMTDSDLWETHNS